MWAVSYTTVKTRLTLVERKIYDDVQLTYVIGFYSLICLLVHGSVDALVLTD